MCGSVSIFSVFKIWKTDIWYRFKGIASISIWINNNFKSTNYTNTAWIAKNDRFALTWIMNFLYFVFLCYIWYHQDFPDTKSNLLSSASNYRAFPTELWFENKLSHPFTPIFHIFNIFNYTNECIYFIMIIRRMLYAEGCRFKQLLVMNGSRQS